jgi:hypothetical protein
MIPVVAVVATVATPLAGWDTTVRDEVLTAEAPPVTRVSTLNWLGGEVLPGV